MSHEQERVNGGGIVDERDHAVSSLAQSSVVLERYRSAFIQRPCVLQTLVGLSIELAHKKPLLELHNRTWRVLPQDPYHRVTEVVCAVKPSSIRPPAKKQMVDEPTVIAMPIHVNDILTVGHKEHVVMRPTEIRASGCHGLKLIELRVNLFVGDR